MGNNCDGFYWDNFDECHFSVVHKMLDGWITVAKYKEEDGLWFNVADEWGKASRDESIAASRAILQHFGEKSE